MLIRVERHARTRDDCYASLRQKLAAQSTSCWSSRLSYQNAAVPTHGLLNSPATSNDEQTSHAKTLPTEARTYHPMRAVLTHTESAVQNRVCSARRGWDHW